MRFKSKFNNKNNNNNNIYYGVMDFSLIVTDFKSKQKCNFWRK